MRTNLFSLRPITNYHEIGTSEAPVFLIPFPPLRGILQIHDQLWRNAQDDDILDELTSLLVRCQTQDHCPENDFAYRLESCC
jgi:hypothetical protein